MNPSKENCEQAIEYLGLVESGDYDPASYFKLLREFLQTVLSSNRLPEERFFAAIHEEDRIRQAKLVKQGKDKVSK